MLSHDYITCVCRVSDRIIRPELNTLNSNVQLSAVPVASFEKYNYVLKGCKPVDLSVLSVPGISTNGHLLRSFMNVSKDMIKHSRMQHSSKYQLSQDLYDKQVSLATGIMLMSCDSFFCFSVFSSLLFL